MTKGGSQGLSEWMVELARKTPWKDLSWQSDKHTDAEQEPLKELRRIKGQLELGKMQMDWRNQSSEKVGERKKLPSLLDPTAPGFSGFGTELDMLLKKRKASSESNERADTEISELKKLSNPRLQRGDPSWLSQFPAGSARLYKEQENERGLDILSDLIDAQQGELGAGHLLDPTAPGYSGFGTEEDMELARRLKKHQMGLLSPSSKQLLQYNPDRVKRSRRLDPI